MPADGFRPFEIKGKQLEDGIRDWDALVPQPYDKNNVDAYSRCRVILMNGIELLAVPQERCSLCGAGLDNRHLRHDLISPRTERLSVCHTCRDASLGEGYRPAA